MRFPNAARDGMIDELGNCSCRPKIGWSPWLMEHFRADLPLSKDSSHGILAVPLAGNHKGVAVNNQQNLPCGG